MKNNKILILANHYITLYSFRKELIKELLNCGYKLFLSLPPSDDNAFFANLGCTIIETSISRRGMNPIKDLQLLRFYKRLFRTIDPGIILSYTIKPNIYGAFASNTLGYKQICNITGTGATFLKKGFINSLCTLLYRLSVRNAYRVFFQNTGDRDLFIKKKMVSNNYSLIPGSGVNLEQYQFVPMQNTSDISFLFIGRVMQLKGIDEYISCARTLSKKYDNIHFYVAGWNEQTKYKSLIEEAQKEGVIEYIGFRKDIDTWIKNCHCIILPSHGGEGVPNVLLESAAIGRVCIGSRVNGTVDVIDDGITGYLFTPRDTNDLIKAVEKFLSLSFERRQQMGAMGRKKVEREFDRKIVIDAYLSEIKKAIE